MPASFSVQPIVELSRPIDAIDKEALIFLSTLRVNGLTTSDVLNVISRMFFWVFSDLDEKTMTDVVETMEGEKKDERVASVDAGPAVDVVSNYHGFGRGVTVSGSG